MLSDLLSPRYAAPATAGGRALLSWLALVFLVGCTPAPNVGTISDVERCKSIISSPRCRLQAGTVSTASYSDCSAVRRACKFFVESTTLKNLKEKTVSEEKTKKQPLVERLRKSLEQNRQRETASDIEKAAQARLGEDNFVYVREAHTLASLPLDALDALVADVKRIRADYETEYGFVLEKLGDE